MRLAVRYRGAAVLVVFVHAGVVPRHGQAIVIPGAQVAQAVTNRVSQVIAGELGPEEALDLAAEEIQAAMEDADYPMAPLP